MSLLNAIAKASGSPKRNYCTQGRYLVSLSSAFIREAGYSDDGTQLSALAGFRGKLIWCSRPGFGTDAEPPQGAEVEANDRLMFPEGMARVRRGLAVCKSAKEGRTCDQGTLGLELKDGESAADFNKRISAEIGRLTSSEQPLVDALVVFSCTNRTPKNAKPREDGSIPVYTVFEVELPTESDFKKAGLA